ncbi:flagellar motor switch protein FliG [Thiolapillus brandeum]|uniref:Flagellar motor switch protein FliG n=1 Tax=Thiolapillus brandeum TaxID=1076588 RepID=A0A7U6GIM3_9GAMM|nr:flagellar motor switch protein FliG [Thiolapillus brandeum]BAO44307.1 flagellar motor switch protein G [Thiolapillus brandeum]
MSDQEQVTVDGLERAAIFMMSLGEKEAAAIIRYMEPKEVQRVGSAMAALSHVTHEQIDRVLGSFAEAVERETALGLDSEEYVRNTLVEAFGVEKAVNLIDRILTKPNSKGIESLKWLDPRAIAEIFRFEHPQIVSIVLSYLDNDQAAEVLKYFPEERRADVLMRIATLDGVQPSALQELDDILERQYAGSFSLTSPASGGKETAANILNFLDADAEQKITEAIQKVDEALAEEIQNLMFVFSNLLDVDDRGIQTLLREVPSDTLLLALKGADQDVQNKIFKNMSKRAADMLRDDLEAKGPVRLSEVEEAQKAILAVAKRLADEGEIALGGSGGDEFV